MPNLVYLPFLSLRSFRLDAITLALVVFSLGGCGGGSSNSTGSGTTQQTSSTAVQVDFPWAFRFADTSDNSQKPLTVDANLLLTSTDLNSVAIEVQGACTTPSSASEIVTGTISGNAVSITLTYGGETMLLTGALATDDGSMSGNYSATGACGPDSGRWAAFKIADANENENDNADGFGYIGLLQPEESYQPIGSITANFTTDTNLNVIGNFSTNVGCFNVNVSGTQIGARIQGTGTDASGTPLQFAFVADDVAFHSMTGFITENNTCSIYSGATLTPPNVAAGPGITVPNLP